MRKTGDVTMIPSLLHVRFFILTFDCQIKFLIADNPTMYDFGLVTEEIAHSFDLAAEAHKEVSHWLMR